MSTDLHDIGDEAMPRHYSIPKAPPGFLTNAEAKARIIAAGAPWSERSLDRARTRGEIPFVKRDGYIYNTVEGVDAYIKRRTAIEAFGADPAPFAFAEVA
jgi:hypothetical protein